MQNKKVVITISAIALIAFGAVFYLIVQRINEAGKNISQQTKNEQTDPSDTLSQVKCNFTNDKDAYQKSIEDQNINICECISDVETKDTCKYTIVDLQMYSQAIAQFDSTLCNEIMEESRKSACLTMVQSGKKYLSEKDPQHLANIYSISHNEEAIGELEKLIQADSTNIANLILLSLAYSEKGLKEQEQGRDQTPYVNKALETIKKAKKLDSNNSEVYRAEGYAYEIKPDIFQAITLYDKAIELDSNNSLAYAGRGHAKSMTGILEGALEDFKKAAKLDTNNENIFIYANLCRLESSRDDLSGDAIKDCKIVVDGGSSDPVFKSESSQILASIYTKNKDYSQARNYLLISKTLTPNDPNLYISFSKLEFAEENYTVAQSQAEKAINLSPTKSASYLALANALYMQEKFNEAIQKAEKGVSLVQNDVSLLDPNKDAMIRDFYYTISHSYKHLGDSANQKKYMDMAESVFSK